MREARDFSWYGLLLSIRLLATPLPFPRWLGVFLTHVKMFQCPGYAIDPSILAESGCRRK